MSDKPSICNTHPFFKGWAKPGPLPDPDAGLAVGEGETVDALSGHFRIAQLRSGHRFSTDDILTAWYGTSWCPSAARVLDLGSGIGSVAMVAAWRLRGASFVTVEAQEVSVALAKKSLAYNGLAQRFDVRTGDFRDPDVLAGDERFDLVLGSPPYFPPGTGVHSEHPQKLACRFELRGDISDYCRVASRHLTHGGWFACVFPVHPDEQKTRVFDAAKDAGLTVVRWRPVFLREGEAYALGLFGMVRSDHLPEDFREQTWEEPPLYVRDAAGDVHPEYAAVKLSIGFPP